MPRESPTCGVGPAPRHRAPAGRGRAGLLVLLVCASAAAQGIDVDSADLYVRGGRLASGAWGCGFAILANHRTRDDPHIEWDIDVEQVNNGRNIVVSVAAASFTMTRKSRAVRAPVTDLAFAIDPDPQPIRVRFAGPADAAGAVHGELASDDASRLFAAVGAGSFVTLVLAFADGPPQSLRFHFARDSAGPAQGVFAELCRPEAAAR